MPTKVGTLNTGSPEALWFAGDLRLYLGSPSTIQVGIMRGQRIAFRLLGCFVFAGLCFAFLVAASPARRQDPQQTNQQQRPRTVGSQGNTNTRPQTNSSPEEVGEGDVVRVETQLVSVPTVVTDRNGRPVTGLHTDNFAVFEDGRPQRVTNFSTTEAPFEIALLLDTSGSTREELGLIREAAKAFVGALRSGDRVAIVAFNNAPQNGPNVAAVEVLSALTSDRQLLSKAIDNIGTSNGTPFYDALGRIADQVFRDPPREEVRGRRAIVALTDGVDSTSNSGYDEARAKLLRAGLACYFIQVSTEDYVEDRLLKDCQDDGRLTLSAKQLERFRQLFVPTATKEDYQDFCRLGQFERMDISRQLYNLARGEMSAMAKDSGGRNFSAADLQDARAAFAEVANEIGTQYNLGYYPSNKLHDGQLRKIRVELRGVRDANARAREGYYAPKQ
jgi:Ca-activated chloride channel homolog